MTIIDDSYNASPVSMKAGLEVLSSMKPGARKIAVLADMKELGPDTVEFHREIGRYIAEHPVDQVLLYGELAAAIGQGIRLSLIHISGALRQVQGQAHRRSVGAGEGPPGRKTGAGDRHQPHPGGRGQDHHHRGSGRRDVYKRQAWYASSPVTRRAGLCLSRCMRGCR